MINIVFYKEAFHVDSGGHTVSFESVGAVADQIARTVKKSPFPVDISFLPRWELRSYQPLTPQQRMKIMSAMKARSLRYIAIEQ